MHPPLDSAWEEANKKEAYHMAAEQRRREGVKHGGSASDLIADLLRQAGTCDELLALLTQHSSRLTALHVSCALGRLLELLQARPEPPPVKHVVAAIVDAADRCLLRTAHKLSALSLPAVVYRYGRLQHHDPRVVSALCSRALEVLPELTGPQLAKLTWGLGQQQRLAAQAAADAAAGGAGGTGGAGGAGGSNQPACTTTAATHTSASGGGRDAMAAVAAAAPSAGNGGSNSPAASSSTTRLAVTASHWNCSEALTGKLVLKLDELIPLQGEFDGAGFAMTAAGLQMLGLCNGLYDQLVLNMMAAVEQSVAADAAARRGGRCGGGSSTAGRSRAAQQRCGWQEWHVQRLLEFFAAMPRTGLQPHQQPPLQTAEARSPDQQHQPGCAVLTRRGGSGSSSSSTMAGRNRASSAPGNSNSSSSRSGVGSDVFAQRCDSEDMAEAAAAMLGALKRAGFKTDM